MYSPLCLSLCLLTLGFGLALSRDTRRRCLGNPHQPLPSLTPLPLERSAHLSRVPVQPVRRPQSSLRSGHGQHCLRTPELLGANPQSPRGRRAGTQSLTERDPAVEAARGCSAQRTLHTGVLVPDPRMGGAGGGAEARGGDIGGRLSGRRQRAEEDRERPLLPRWLLCCPEYRLPVRP